MWRLLTSGARRAAAGCRRRSRPIRKTAPCRRSLRTRRTAPPRSRSGPGARGRCWSRPRWTGTGGGTSRRTRRPPRPGARSAEPRVGAEGAHLAADDGGGIQPGLGEDPAIIVVVVVLPWLPATATPSLRRISSASISARGMTGMSARARGRDLGVVVRTALETTTTSARATFRRGGRSDAGAQRRQAAGNVAVAQVRAGHPVAQVQQHLGDAAHADAADADEMDGDVTLFEHGRRCSPALTRLPSALRRRWRRYRRASPSARRRCPRVASARASVPIASAMLRAAGGMLRISSTRSAEARRRRSRLRQHDRRAGALERQRVHRLVVVGGGRQGDQDRRPPHDRQLGQRQRARRARRRRPPGPARRACRR